MKIIDNEEKMTPEEAVGAYQAEAEPDQPAKGDSAPAPKADAKEEPAPAARDELVDKLRVAHVAVHAIMLLVLFWFSFRESYANGANISFGSSLILETLPLDGSKDGAKYQGQPGVGGLLPPYSAHVYLHVGD